MSTTLTIAICFNTLAAQPVAVPPATPAVPTQSYVERGADDLSHGSDQGHSCEHCGRTQYQKWPLGDWLCPRCDMSQRQEYYPTNHGNYYFRPYHMQRVIEQQGQAVSWGEDPRNPYGHLVFDRVYEQLQSEQAAKAEPLPPAKVTPPPMDKPSRPSVQPKQEAAPAPLPDDSADDTPTQKQGARPRFKFSR